MWYAFTESRMYLLQLSQNNVQPGTSLFLTRRTRKKTNSCLKRTFRALSDILSARLYCYFFYSSGWIYPLARRLSFRPVEHGPFHNGSSRSQNKRDHVLRIHASPSSSSARSLDNCQPPVGQTSRSERFE